MAWSIAQVARMSKVTSRTLRHYDAIGLLPPAYVGSNGYRYYEQEQLLRLQQIMLFRELGLGLEAIAEILSGRHDSVTVLRKHHEWLQAERERFGALAQTVARTIEQLEGGDTVQPQELFEGFDADRQARYEAELVERFGECIEAKIAESKRGMSTWTKEDATDFTAGWKRIIENFRDVAAEGASVDDRRTLDAVDEHYRWLCRAWTPNRESYTGLGRLYAEYPDFRSQFEDLRPGLADFVGDAMAAYARARLS
ncbi:HTH-type transcriptional regulator SkgA [Longimycelium tulufanense]|uniref:HTH-type transcriptional regulator SkgA n=1 Tax=Longimycelium tulufanense TaxID=907463 RepID=A0A8J3FYN4_9PSEU|nr:MerR family transcriptional regulator [Longimycelium tulufanense]GGM73508.1 HTH-type transcriptional regulator SkgA [Longimycelium tulufanense]